MASSLEDDIYKLTFVSDKNFLIQEYTYFKREASEEFQISQYDGPDDEELVGRRDSKADAESREAEIQESIDQYTSFVKRAEQEDARREDDEEDEKEEIIGTEQDWLLCRNDEYYKELCAVRHLESLLQNIWASTYTDCVSPEHDTGCPKALWEKCTPKERGEALIVACRLNLTKKAVSLINSDAYLIENKDIMLDNHYRTALVYAAMHHNKVVVQAILEYVKSLYYVKEDDYNSVADYVCESDKKQQTALYYAYTRKRKSFEHFAKGYRICSLLAPYNSSVLLPVYKDGALFSNTCREQTAQYYLQRSQFIGVSVIRQQAKFKDTCDLREQSGWPVQTTLQLKEPTQADKRRHQLEFSETVSAYICYVQMQRNDFKLITFAAENTFTEDFAQFINKVCKDVLNEIKIDKHAASRNASASSLGLAVLAAKSAIAKAIAAVGGGATVMKPIFKQTGILIKPINIPGSITAIQQAAAVVSAPTAVALGTAAMALYAYANRTPTMSLDVICATTLVIYKAAIDLSTIDLEEEGKLAGQEVFLV